MTNDFGNTFLLEKEEPSMKTSIKKQNNKLHDN